jgi:hypothetical protein
VSKMQLKVALLTGCSMGRTNVAANTDNWFRRFVRYIIARNYLLNIITLQDCFSRERFIAC